MNTKKLLMAAAAGAMMLAGCDVTDPIYDTAHPDHGKIALVTDWSATNTATPPAGGYSVMIGDYSATLTEAANTFDHLFDPGEYTIYAHNSPDNVALSSTMATVAVSGSHLDPQPGWFYTGVQAVTVEKDADHSFTVDMAQQVRELTLVIEPTGGTINRIAAITGTLGGVAGTLDFTTGTHGASSTVPLTFYATDVAEDANWYSTVRLLGITGAEQKLDITVTYSDGTPPVQLEDYALGSLLSGFNDDKATPLTLGGQLMETPTGAGFTATITGWDQVSGDSVIAD